MSIQLTAEQLQVLGIQNYSPSEKDIFLARIGGIVFDSAIMRLLDTFSEERMAAFMHAVDAYDSFDDVLAHIQRTAPAFNQYLIEEQNNFITKFVRGVKELEV